jgi:hypothetical protein
MRTRVILPVLGVLALASAPAVGADDANAPITIAVVSQMAGQSGFNRALTALAEGNTEESGRDLSGVLVQYPWLRIVPQNPEVAVQVERRSRNESKTTDNNGRVTVHHKYRIEALVDTGRGGRIPVWADHSLSTAVNGYRDDTGVFRAMAGTLAAHVVTAISGQLDALRPHRVRPGFNYEAKYRFLVKGDGLEVTYVAEGSPAEEAGLRFRDRIKSINGEKNTDQMALIGRWMWVSGPGAQYAIEYERNKQKLTTTLVLASPGDAPPATADARVAAPRRAANGTPAAPAAQGGGARAFAGGGSAPASGGGEVQLRVGMTEAELVSALGQPQKKVSFPPKAVWTYEAFTVTLVSGKVTNIK